MKKQKISYRNLIILIVAIILLIIIGITITMARYKSAGSGEIVTEIALFVFEEGFQRGNIMLAGLYPRSEDEPFEYEFTIANTDGTNVAETSLEYTMELKMTTNLPLDIKIYKKDSNNAIYSELEEIENEIVLDESGQNYIRRIKIEDGSFIYSFSVCFYIFYK